MSTYHIWPVRSAGTMTSGMKSKICPAAFQASQGSSCVQPR